MLSQLVVDNVPSIRKNRWLPIEPLKEYIESDRFRQPNERTVNEGSYQVVRSISGVLSQSQRTAYYRALHTGYITDYMADGIAVKCGLHPSEIWSDWPELVDPPTADQFIGG